MSKMKKLIILIVWIVIMFSSVFASYNISLKDKQKLDNLSKKIYNIIEKKYKTTSKRKYLYQTMVDTIDGYIVLHKLNTRQKVILLYLKTLLLLHMWYKIWNCIDLNVVK